ncbi:TRAP transporter large permease [Kushneria sp. TE3]|uniref:TRAP transporter large permease n=1 Tax=Kushneria sp. TE3 TaxID=3449832 RepID=UPI003F687CEF
MNILLVIPALFALVLVNVPIAVAIGVVAVVGIIVAQGFDSLVNVPLALFTGASSFPLVAIPLFILAGALMNTTGLSKRLINFVSALIGFVRGGLAMVNVGVSMFFAEISGSAVADVAATGSILIPEMKKRRYNANFAAAITSSSASLAIIIPPSLSMILYGAIAETSIIKLFVAGIVPGILGGVLLAGCCYYYAVKYNLPREESFSLSRLGKAFREAFWALLLPVVILGSIFSGFVTATEGAGIAVLAALVIGGCIYREFNARLLYRAVLDGVVQTSVVMLLVATSAILGVYLTEMQIPQQLARGILDITQNPILVLALLNVLLLVLGMFLHGAAAIILVVPIVMPLIQQIGVDPIQFGLILTLNLAIGQQTPPVASVLATSCSIAKTDMWQTTKVNLPMIGALFVLLMIVTYVPFMTLGVVDWFYPPAGG